MGDYGLKIALAGNDVGTAGLQQIAFSSQFPIFKIALSGNVTVTVPGGDGINTVSGTTTIAHNLGYFPGFRCYGYGDAGSTLRQSLDFNAFYGRSNGVYLTSRMGTQNLYIFSYNFGTQALTTTVYYYIYADPGA